MNVRRLFIAMAPPPSVIEELAGAVERRPREAGIRWIPQEMWHVTLQFLGAVDEDRLDDVRLACAFGAGRITAFEGAFGGVGAFPSKRRARVIWVGMPEGADRMAALSTSVQAQTARRGFASETREFHAHLTIGRLRRPRDIGDLVGALDVNPVPVSVEAITLFESHLGAEGARYDVIDVFPLQS